MMQTPQAHNIENHVPQILERIGTHRHWLWPQGYSHFGAAMGDARICALHPESLPAKVARAASFGQRLVRAPRYWLYYAFNIGGCMIYQDEQSCSWYPTPAYVIDEPASVLELDQQIAAAFPGIQFARGLYNPMSGTIETWSALIPYRVEPYRPTYPTPPYQESIAVPQETPAYGLAPAPAQPGGGEGTYWRL